LKRKESERAQSARVQSFTHLKKQESLEPWINLKVNEIGNFIITLISKLNYHIIKNQNYYFLIFIGSLSSDNNFKIIYDKHNVNG
jgi:hypothetical protein